MNRAQRRARNRKIKKSKRKKTELEQKLGLFDLMPEECMVCMEPFDRKNKEQVKTWNVVVRKRKHRKSLLPYMLEQGKTNHR